MCFVQVFKHLDIHSDGFATALVCRAFYCKFREHLSGPFRTRLSTRWRVTHANYVGAESRLPRWPVVRGGGATRQPRDAAWLHVSNCPWDWRTCARAAGGGHLDVLQWARAKGCPWDEQTCAEAAAGSHLAVLQWAHAQGCPWDGRTCGLAARGGHLAVLQWARARGCPWDKGTCAMAALGGHLAVLQWARAQRRAMGHVYVLARGGWRPPRGAAVGARARDCPWNGNTCANAAAGGHLAVRVGARSGLPVGRAYVRDGGVRRPPRGAAVGARSGLPVGRVDVRARGGAATSRCYSGRTLRGCPWDSYTCAKAAGGGHLDVLEWARALGAADGTGTRARKRRLAATLRCCGGRAPGAAGGTLTRANVRRKAATSRCCSGRAPGGCPWDEDTCNKAAVRNAGRDLRGP